jgi:hypothetical protein
MRKLAVRATQLFGYGHEDGQGVTVGSGLVAAGRGRTAATGESSARIIELDNATKIVEAKISERRVGERKRGGTQTQAAKPIETPFAGTERLPTVAPRIPVRDRFRNLHAGLFDLR